MNILNNKEGIKWAILAIFSNPDKKMTAQKHYLYEGVNRIGSDTQHNDIYLNIEGISQVHAEITITPEGDAFITDLTSTQGVFKRASFNPSKKVRLADHSRYSLLPDHEFYLGKYKCFVVTFDEDYKQGDYQREKERLNIHNEISLTMDLEETDLDEEDYSNNVMKSVDNVLPSTGQNHSDGHVVNHDEFNHTPEITSDTESYEKTLEIASNTGDNREVEENLFELNRRSPTINTVQEFEKTLELSSQHTEELEEEEIKDDINLLRNVQSLQATLINSPQNTQSELVSANKNGVKILSPTLYDGDSNSVQFSQQQNKRNGKKQRKSPLPLSPTFLDEESHFSLLSVVGNNSQKMCLSATIVDTFESFTRDKDVEFDQLLIKKIKQKEDELEQMKAQHFKHQNNNEKCKPLLLQEQVRHLGVNKQEKQCFINVLPSSLRDCANQNDGRGGDQQKRNINLDKVNNFEDLFGNDEEEEEEEEQRRLRQMNAKKEEENNSGTMKILTAALRQKCPLRTLTMSETKGQMQIVGGSMQIVLKKDITSSDENVFFKSRSDVKKKDIVERQKKEEEEEDESSNESVGEDPKKKLKVQPNWGILKSKSVRQCEENSRNSLSSDDYRKYNVPLLNVKEDGMVAEDVNGDLIRTSLKIGVSGFTFKRDQKKGMKELQLILCEDDDNEFDVLIVNQVNRNARILLALMKKKPIVNELWLTESIKKKDIQTDFSKYLPLSQQKNTMKNEDTLFEEDFSTLVKKRKSIGQDNLIFEGSTFYISKSLKNPTDLDLINLVKAGGGLIRKTLPTKSVKKNDQKVFAILGKNDIGLYKVLIKLKQVMCTTSDVILNSAQNSEFEVDQKFVIDSHNYFSN